MAKTLADFARYLKQNAGEPKLVGAAVISQPNGGTKGVAIMVGYKIVVHDDDWQASFAPCEFTGGALLVDPTAGGREDVFFGSIESLSAALDKKFGFSLVEYAAASNG